MNRRQFGKAGIPAAMAGMSGVLGATPEGKQKLYELRTYELRNDLNVAALHEFVEKSYLPALRAVVSGPVGAFTVSSGQNTPSLILLLQYDQETGLRANTDLVSGQSDFTTAWKEFESQVMPYVRIHSQLFKAFAGHPALEKPPGADRHLFELRTYESKNAFKAAAKVEMFNVEEIEIFRKCGMAPVFFGEALIGSRLPHLTYMLAFKDSDAREKAWDTFRAHPDWIRIRDDARWADTVSNIQMSLLSSTAYSEIR